ncbi:serine/alanine racemase [Paenibacillus endophyticus]|uniref:Serine/alanine racemase n=1 Tax=Paenibacillus endophyticus TaxID=1294268 RepID=A0A7W5C5I2_9BACL|nr:acyltransferase [Paenibacillus endophyticus]MBB3151561.1 serine/alanine racemase [Paenibacillus endophyticus]
MNNKRNEGGLDWLKFVAALFVIANHTGPLLSFDEYADYLFSGILSRVAVPVFFMSSGYFFFRKLTGDPAVDQKALMKYVKKIAYLYGISILLYVPLNVYNGYFLEDFTVYSFMKDLVFDGTFYHLWYLPALIVGLCLVYVLYQKLSIRWLAAVGSLLFILGLLGDSYYAVTENAAGLKLMYDAMFQAFDYTRNGLFYAPIFLILGAWAAKHPKPERKPIASAGLFLVFLGFMFAEAILLHEADFPRHDSMYIFAIPATYYLFQWALTWKWNFNKEYREWRVWIYILHPLAIVLVRGTAEAAHLEKWLITNHLIHFTAVCVASIIMAVAAVRISVIKFKLRP